jgi:hypothetical protein
MRDRPVVGDDGHCRRRNAIDPPVAIIIKERGDILLRQ